MLQLISEYTGFTCLSLVGAMPKEDGPGVMFGAVHHGETAGPLHKNFATFNPVAFEQWSESFCEFMQVVAKSHGESQSYVIKRSRANTMRPNAANAQAPAASAQTTSTYLAPDATPPLPTTSSTPAAVPDTSLWDADLPDLVLLKPTVVFL